LDHLLLQAGYIINTMWHVSIQLQKRHSIWVLNVLYCDMTCKSFEGGAELLIFGQNLSKLFSDFVLCGTKSDLQKVLTCN